MKVHELITRLQNFDMNLNVKCLHESTDWAYNDDAEESFEVDTIEENFVSELTLVGMGAGASYILIK